MFIFHSRKFAVCFLQEYSIILAKNLGTASLSDDISPTNDLVPLKAVEQKKQVVLRFISL